MTITTRTERPAPLSIRLSFDERQTLLARAGDVPISTYIKLIVFADDKTTSRRLPRRSGADTAMLARILAALGSTHLAANISRLSSEAQSGSLLIDYETASCLRDACDDIRSIHLNLVQALGKKAPEQKAPPKTLSKNFSRQAFNLEDAE